MLFQQTIEKLNSMKLFGMVDALEEQRAQPKIQELSFEERFSLLIERQHLLKENRALASRLKSAKLKVTACIEDVDYRHHRGLKKAQIQHLASLDWVQYHQNCIICGPTGCGKTWLACALAQKACRAGYRVRYFYAPKLFRELMNARADGSFVKFLKRLEQTHLLIVDDWALHDLDDIKCRDFLEIIDDRQGTASTIITSQVPPKLWHETITNSTVADAILDRVVHNAHRIELNGDSMRKPSKEVSNAQ